jgi:hypothetical protein
MFTVLTPSDHDFILSENELCALWFRAELRILDLFEDTLALDNILKNALRCGVHNPPTPQSNSGEFSGTVFEENYSQTLTVDLNDEVTASSIEFPDSTRDRQSSLQSSVRGSVIVSQSSHFANKEVYEDYISFEKANLTEGK